MTVFPQDNKHQKPTEITPKKEESAAAGVKTMTDWTRAMEVDHRQAGKLNSKQRENETEVLRTDECNESDQSTKNELRLKQEKLEATEEMFLHHSKSEESNAKPSHSYIALIAMAILSKPSKKVLLGDIYKYISDKFPYYRSKDKSWRNSIRHNLSLNECFIKAGRSENGKGNYWAVHPANLEDFTNGDFRRRRARRRVRKSHSSLCTRYGALPFPQNAPGFINYRPEFYHYPYYIATYNAQNCIRKSSFAIDSLLSPRVPAAVASPSGLQSPVEYSHVTAPLCSTGILRSYPTTGTSYSTFASSAHPHTLAYPLGHIPNSQVPTESWNDTLKKLKARFQTQS